jgi:tRNA (guanine-N7-)-methyltransferase
VTVTERRRHLLYGRRKGPKPSVRQERLRESLLPKLTLHPKAGCDPRTYFSVPVRDIWLEVGFGAGEHLVWHAKKNPAVGIIGAEPYEAGVVKLLSKLDDAEQSAAENIRIHQGDARDILARLPASCLGRIFILFPDPWPKTRHHKRRFIVRETLDALARVMRRGAELRFSTDDAGYLCWTLERLSAHADFGWTAERAADWTTRPSDWPETRYEAKALHGPPAYLRFLRK